MSIKDFTNYIEEFDFYSDSLFNHVVPTMPDPNLLECGNYGTLIEAIQHKHDVFTLEGSPDYKYIIIKGKNEVTLDKATLHQLGMELVTLAEEMVI